MSNLRTVASLETPIVYETSGGFSNFTFIEDHFGNIDTIHRIFSEARNLKYNTLVFEKIPSVDFSHEDDLDLTEAGLTLSHENLVRLSFFKSAFKSPEQIRSQKPEDFLGYAILKNVPLLPPSQGFKWIVFESVIQPSLHTDNYLLRKRNYNVNVGGFIFTISGILFCEQNYLTNVCAHAALRTCISMLIPSADISYRVMNTILRQKNVSHQLGEGLLPSQIEIILEELGIECGMYHYYGAENLSSDQTGTLTNPPLPFQAYLYGSIESAYPAILAFYAKSGQKGHVISIFGHTFNEDAWVPRAETAYFHVGGHTKYIPSEMWLSAYICHDDLYGSYYCLPRYYITEEYEKIVFAFRPSLTQYSAPLAEGIAAYYLTTLLPIIEEQGHSNKWAERLARSIREMGSWFVMRTLYVSSAEYVEHLRLSTDFEGRTIPSSLIEILNATLPKNLWVAEISLPELFPANRRKLGEMILDPTKEITLTEDLSTVVMARIINKIYCMRNVEGKLDITIYESGINSHTQLLTFP